MPSISNIRNRDIQLITLLMESLRVAHQPIDNRRATDVLYSVSDSPECSVLTLSMVLKAASVAAANQGPGVNI